MEKGTFILKASHYKMFRNRLTQEQKGNLLDAMFCDWLGEDYTTHLQDEKVAMVFDVMQDFYQQCNEAYLEKCEQNRENIKKRWDKKKNTNNSGVFNRIQPNTEVSHRIPTDTDMNCSDSDMNCSELSCSDSDRESKKKRSPQFKKPTIAEIQEYCKQRGNNVDAEQFFSFYESNGWKVGRVPMKDWKMCVITWERRHAEDKKRSSYSKYGKPTRVPVTGDYSKDKQLGFQV